MRNAPMTAEVEDPAECDEGFGPCGACPSCKPALYVHVAGKSVERELVAAILKEFGSPPPPDAAVREAVEYLSSGWGESTEASRFRSHVETLLRAVQAPRPLWPDDDPMIVAMAAERDALRARVVELEEEISDRADTEASMTQEMLKLGTRADKLEAVLRKVLEWDGTDSRGVDAVWADEAKAALSECEEV